jgi:hypothetical protein
MRDRDSSQFNWRRFFVRWPFLPPSFFVMIALYQGLNHWPAPVETQFAGLAVYGLSIDGLIPFVPFSLLLYLSFFAFYLLHKPLLAGADIRRQCFWRMEIVLIVMSVASCACFLLFPTQIELRQQALLSLASGDYPAWLVNACQGLFLLDNEINAWPSIHVSQPLFIMLCVTRLQLYPPQKLALLWLLLLGVMSSVLTLKQHYVWDAATGVLLALIAVQYYFSWSKRISWTQPSIGEPV